MSEDVKQQVYESLSFDIDSANNKIKELESLQNSVSDQYNKLQDDYDNLEQYSRRNCLLIHGVPEQQGKSTDNEVLKIFNKAPQINIKIRRYR